jgi:antitoxin component YwqK of YwqJK toxin-antitoxin module
VIKNIVTSLVLISVAFQGFSQDKEYKSAKDYAIEGATFFADEQYEQAFEAFSQVNYNDTAYYELTLAALESAAEVDMIDSLLAISTRVLEDDRYNPMKEKFIIMKGFGLIQQEKYEETVAFYDSYLNEFPKSSLIHYNRAVALYDLKRYDESVDALQTSLRFNPRNAAAHIKLALICAEAEDYTKAALCMNMALFLSAAEERALTLISALEEIYAMDIEKKIGKVNYREDEDFEEIDLLIKNKVAENKKYKIGFKFPYNVFKYNHLVFDQIEYDESSNGFWNQNYVRFFKEIMNNDEFNYFSYFQSIRIENPKVQKTLSRNTTSIKNSVTRVASFFAKFMNERRVWNGTDYVANDLVHYGSYGFNAKVKYNEDGSQVGPYVAYSDGGLVEAEGTLDSDGKQDGLWTFYDENGLLSIKTNFSGGELDGMRSTYYANGSLKDRFNVKDGEIDGKVELFTAYNKLRREIPYDNGKENGTLKAYYNTGELYLEQEFVDGELNGKSTQYFANGDESVKQNYLDGKNDGEYLELYRGGGIRTKGQYEEGEPAGHWEYYYKNGQLRERGDFKNGYRIGLWNAMRKTASFPKKRTTEKQERKWESTKSTT